MQSNWRTVEAWREMNVPIATASNEACKMYDATLSQYVCWKEDASVGGIEGSLDKMMAADPDFVMGHVIKNGLELIGTGRSAKLDPAFQGDIDKMLKLSDSQPSVSLSEKQHAKALKLFAEGDFGAAAQLWEDILVEHPLDTLALKFAHDSYFYLGWSSCIRDSIARVLPHYTTSNPFYGYILGMYSFGLEETNLYDQAEKTARKGLEVNASDAWSTHTLCHVMEMCGRQDEGISFLNSTVQDWEPCGMLACHNFWHWALYYIEKGEYQAALDIFDSQVKKRATQSGAMLDMVDLSSLLYRLEMEDCCIYFIIMTMKHNHTRPKLTNAEGCQQYRQKMMQDPILLKRMRDADKARAKRNRDQAKTPEQIEHARMLQRQRQKHYEWEDVFEVCRPHLDDHILVFNDVHLLMACLRAGKTEAVQHLMDSIQRFIKEGKGQNRDVMEKVGNAICKAMVAYNNEDFATAVDLLAPLRYDIITIGGSHAQRDVFNLFLIQAAIKSPKAKHNCLARSLLTERKALKEHAPMTDRMVQRAMALHTQ